MIGYAINQQGGWRRVESQDDCGADEKFSTDQPPVVEPSDQPAPAFATVDEVAALREQVAKLLAAQGKA